MTTQTVHHVEDDRISRMHHEMTALAAELSRLRAIEAAATELVDVREAFGSTRNMELATFQALKKALGGL